MSAWDEIDWAELDYWSHFCPCCGDSPCRWAGEPDGFHEADADELWPVAS